MYHLQVEVILEYLLPGTLVFPSPTIELLQKDHDLGVYKTREA